ncbi:GATA-domain-containing protein [Hesseltinella vesiculosa]|uniref:GATA-domain-containing protein n=1 Tax=Hesseltinella vesiculosa TaxID=101127 RepID=A0A1X2GLI0_9FUNG|nr:GATA-domain-containing protein [Hesseltinella vesiculosa]
MLPKAFTKEDRVVLPPINHLDYPKSTIQPMLSPPNSHAPSVSSNSSFTSCSPVIGGQPPSPARGSFEKLEVMDAPIYGTDEERNLSSDVDQIIIHSRGLYDNMIHYKPYLTTCQHDDWRPWMDDMIANANKVLQGLHRLRKHHVPQQPLPSSASPPLHIPSAGYHSYQQVASAPSSSAYSTTLPSPPSSSIRRSAFQPPAPTASVYRSYMSTLSIPGRKRNWANTIPPTRQRRRGKRATVQGRCHSCNISETPEWRRGPDGARTLCNACGLHYAKLARKKAAAEAASKEPSSTPPSS